MDFATAVSSPSKNLISMLNDADLTPRPLRINKRKRQDSDHSGRLGGFRRLSNSSTGGSGPFPPSRTNSRAGHGYSLGSLRVRKQRQSYTAPVDLATDSVAPAARLRRGATMSYPPTFVKPPSTREQDEPRVSTGSTRAVTLGTSRQGPFTHQVTHLSQQASSSSRNRSNPLDQRAPRPHFPLQENPSLETDRNIRQVPSFKHRFLSRIMSSLINRPGSSHSTIEESGCRRHSAEVFPGSNAADHSSSSRRASSSTVDTCTSLDTDFETSLSAFPEPPVSNLTSPIEFSSFDHAQPDARAYRTLCAPADNAIVRPEITITPEIQTLNTDTSQSLYIAVQIGAVVEAMTNAPYNRHYGLDVAVVIDNSQFTSPTTLVASCETARFLSTLLDPSNDRMAIICTSSSSAENRDLRTILPLSLPNARKTKGAVDSIVSSLDRPRLSALDAAVRSARALLEQCTPRDQNSELSPFAFGHIFVLTSSSSDIAPEILTHDTIQLHLVCAGSVPWKGEAKVRCNGWKMQSMHTKALQSVTHTKDEDPSSLFNRLRTTVIDARKGLLHGAVSDMVLDIKPGPNCTIEGVIGTRNIPNIQRGEKVVALVRLKVGLPPAAGYTLTPRRQLDGSSPACNDLNKEIDKLLGNTPVTVLNVKLKYKHSLLPSDTQCTMSTACQMKRPLYTPDWQDTAPEAYTEVKNKPQTEVQKRFAFHIATHHAPRQAMMVLIEDFGDGGRRSACPDYIKLLIEELKYQARTIERFDLAEYRSGPVVVTPRELRSDIWGEEHFGQGLFDASNYKPQEWITVGPDELIVQLPLSPSSKSKSHDRKRSEELTNRTGMLKRKPKRSVGRGSENEYRSLSVSTTTELDEATKRLRDLAFKDKRSLGAGVLKSLTYPPYRPKALES